MTALLRIALVALVLVAAPLRTVAACWTAEACCTTHCDDAEAASCCGEEPAGEDEGELDEDACACCELPLVCVAPTLAPPLVLPAAVPTPDPPRSLRGRHPEPGVPPPIGRSA
ncbi:MAG: hypothetical protein AAGI22_30605 [Planctomycetota bacterium]